MKKFILIIYLVSVVVLSGCQENNHLAKSMGKNLLDEHKRTISVCGQWDKFLNSIANYKDTLIKAGMDSVETDEYCRVLIMSAYVRSQNECSDSESRVLLCAYLDNYAGNMEEFNSTYSKHKVPHDVGNFAEGFGRVCLGEGLYNLLF
jgi:hypothetical protein